MADAPQPADPWLPHTLALRAHEIRTTYAGALADWGPANQEAALEMTAAMIGIGAEEVDRILRAAPADRTEKL